jgi:alpha-L-rhamnosidase
MNSFNHYSLGSCGEFLFGGIGGIRPATPGFKTIQIEPVINGGLTWAKTSYDSIHGTIATSWKVTGKQLALEVVVPANTTAVVSFPAKDLASITESGKPIEKVAGVKFLKSENGKATLEVGSGTYQFTSVIGHGYQLSSPRQK